ncbi:MAG: 4Fe-4S dicluster domain-containing protein [Bacteroidia bacterium]|nr:4Fe-4S dicluster domain-containing protein [Bacteroidia bacterium]
MNELINQVTRLLNDKTIDVFIGYGKGSADRIRTIFVRSADQAENLIFNAGCTQNLSGYLLKHEVKHLGKIGILANTAAMRSIMQLASEFQIKDGEVYVLFANPDGSCAEFQDFGSIEKYLENTDTGISTDEKEMIRKLESMTVNERWIYWNKEFDKCIKCYACRAACPMCYCHRCTTDVNQPQWIPVASHELGNLDYHLMRAMHLAGRCVNCGECANACPMDIPLNLLTYQLIEPIRATFGATAGMKADAVYALSTYKPDDKENFII